MIKPEGAAEDRTVQQPANETPTVAIAPAPYGSQQLTPGTLLGDRYRIVSLLGRGGMGEVYRADDLKLGQPVALKFLTRRSGEDRLLYDEIRVGRQVSHPNVCRLHDIADINGQLFITMEFVDGEDLASLLRRVGRLPPDRGVAIAREICSGLAAAHDKGVIHRDLKPGNVMIDGRGRARITDFGLAVAENQEGRHVSAGTPAYMAPEQLAGGQASVQSDLYALGLTLYELFTGRRAFEASSIPELIARQRALDITRPTSLVRDLDPAIERIISHCLEPAPDKRPRNATEVLTQLPGGDPIAAAIAAGETPSPEMVAAAAERGDLPVRTAWIALASFAIMFLAYALLTPRAMLYRLTPIMKEPALLQDRAREVLTATGHALTNVDATYLFLIDISQISWLKNHPTARIQATPFHFLYRQSPVPMRPLNLEQRVDPDNPPLSTSGMANVHLDSGGRLEQLVVVPPQVEDPPAVRRVMNWSPLLAMTGLEDLRVDRPRWAAPVDSDEKAAWVTGDGNVRVEAAAYHGRPVWFAVIRPWDVPDRMPRPATSPFTHLSDLAFFAVLIIAWLGAALLALRNLRRARVDRRGALRVAIFVFITCEIALLLRAHHPGGLREFSILGKVIAYALTLATACWFGYVAIEPLVRRRWPRMLIGWSRLLAGQLHDPMLGRDLLVGFIAGLSLQALRAGIAHMPGASPLMTPASALAQVSETVHWMMRSLFSAAFMPLALVTTLLAFLVVTRSLKVAVVLGFLVMSMAAIDSFTGPQWVRIPGAMIATLLTLTILFRFGILAVAASTFCSLLLMRLPLTFDTSSWYFGRSLFGVLLLVTLAIYGFVTALGGKRALPDIAVET